METEENSASTTLATEDVEYVIITTESLSSDFRPLLDWKKNRSSFATDLIDRTGEIVTTEWISSQPEYWGDPSSHGGKGNDTQTQVRNFIIDAYQTWGTEYVLLGGDNDVIPCRYIRTLVNSFSNIPADVYYAGLDGSWDLDNDGAYGEGDGTGGGADGDEADLLLEVDVGRATVSTSEEVTNFVNKVMTYEQAYSEPYLNSSLLVGEKLDNRPTWGGDYKDEIQDLTFPAQNPELTVQKLYARDGSFSSRGFIDTMNEGVHLVNHMGHGNELSFADLDSGDIESLNNSECFLFFSQACFIGAFDGGTLSTSDSIAESLITSEHGAVAALVNSREGWYQPGGTDGPSQQYDIQFFDAIFQENIRPIGTALSDAKMDLVSQIGATGAMRWCYMTLNLFGDPETAAHFVEERIHDVTVSDLSVQSPSKGNPSNITAQISNEGEIAENDVPVELYVDGVRQNTKYVNISAGGNTSVEFNWTPAESKPYEIIVQTNLSTDAWNENDFMETETEVVWRITAPESIENQTFFQRASIIIEDTGSLYINNSNLEMDGNWTEQFSIQAHGDMIIENSTISCDGDLGYRIHCHPESLFSSSQTEFLNLTGDPGLIIESNDTDIIDSLFEGDGLHINGTTGLSMQAVAFLTPLSISNSTSFSLDDIGVTGGITGISIASSSNFSLSCRVVASEVGIYIEDCTNGTILNSTVENCSEGLLLNRSSSLNLVNNSIKNNSFDLGIDGTLHDHFVHSMISNNVTGGQVLYLVNRSGLIINDSQDIGYLGMVSCNNITVKDQQFQSNIEGALAVESSALNISSCLFAENSIGLKMVDCSDCLVYGNDFMNNTVNAFDDGGNSFNASYPQGGNYWDDYSGDDLMSGTQQDLDGGDGIGDSPYHLDGNSTDYYPLVSSTTTPNHGPVANFSYTPDTIFVGDEVAFNDSSQDPDGYIVNWTWDFGDGNHSYDQDGAHAYAEPGYYTVSLTVMDDSREYDSFSKTIGVNNRLPQADFEFTPQFPEVEEEVQFTDRSHDEDGTVVSWNWTFGDGNSSTVQDPMHAYGEEGTFVVTLEVIDEDGGNSSHSEEIVVGNEFPQADFSFSPSAPTTGDLVRFEDESIDPDGSIEGWEWEFGDGAVSTASDPSHQYADDGVFTVKLVVTDDQGAKDSHSLDIQVSNVAPIASFYYAPSNPYTVQSVQFSDTSLDSDGDIVTWLWDFGEGEMSSERNPSYRFPDQGDYDVVLTVWDDDGALNETVQTVHVENTPPSADFEYPAVIYSNSEIHFLDSSHDPDGEITSWNWSFGDGSFSNERDSTHNFSTPGDFNVTLTVTDDDGGVSSLSKTVHVVDSPPYASFSWTVKENETASTIIFNGTSYDLEGPIRSYLWDFGDGNTSALSSPVHTYHMPGDYTVNLTVTDANGCSSSISRTVEVALPDLDIQISSTVSMDNISTSGALNVTVWVRNYGDFGLEDIRVDFIADGERVEERTISMKGGSNETVTFQWGVVEGNHTLSCEVDTDNVIVENNESNNAASLTVSVDSSDSMDILSILHKNWIPLVLLVSLISLIVIAVMMRRR